MQNQNHIKRWYFYEYFILKKSRLRSHVPLSFQGATAYEEAAAIVGADGAYSATRKAMLRMDRFNYSQVVARHVASLPLAAHFFAFF